MTDRSPRPLRVAIVNGLCVKADAISQSVHGTALALTRGLGAECRLYSYRCDFADLDFRNVAGPADIVFDSGFREADVVIYHFGVYYELFNTIFVAPAKARKVVRYHNVTPKHLVPRSDHRVIDKSLNQRANIGAADEVWADSDFNRQDLVDYGITPDRIRVMPLFVKFPAAAAKPVRAVGAPVEILYVGRFVASKGLLDLVDAIAALPTETPQVRVTLVGNVDFSDANYIAKLREQISRQGLDDKIVFAGKVEDDALARHYADADIFVMPSYHEGFCVPLIEAMHAGCIPICYDAGNLPNLVSDKGPLVQCGDVAGLSGAISNVVRDVVACRRRGHKAMLTWSGRKERIEDYRAGLAKYLQQFEFDAFARRIVDRVNALELGQ